MDKSRKWLSKIRNNKTHQEVADMANIERAYYTQIESGSRNPSVATAKRIAEALNFDWTIFFKENSSDTRQPTGTTG